MPDLKTRSLRDEVALQEKHCTCESSLVLADLQSWHINLKARFSLNNERDESAFLEFNYIFKSIIPNKRPRKTQHLDWKLFGPRWKSVSVSWSGLWQRAGVNTDEASVKCRNLVLKIEILCISGTSLIPWWKVRLCILAWISPFEKLMSCWVFLAQVILLKALNFAKTRGDLECGGFKKKMLIKGSNTSVKCSKTWC